MTEIPWIPFHSIVPGRTHKCTSIDRVAQCHKNHPTKESNNDRTSTSSNKQNTKVMTNPPEREEPDEKRRATCDVDGKPKRGRNDQDPNPSEVANLATQVAVVLRDRTVHDLNHLNLAVKWASWLWVLDWRRRDDFGMSDLAPFVGAVLRDSKLHDLWEETCALMAEIDAGRRGKYAGRRGKT